MFMGEYAHSIDAKGRVILPADFRQELGVSFIITKGLDGSLFPFPQAAWDEFAAKLRTLSIADPNARAFARFFIAGARTLECDKQGRFLVPANLRTYANIGLKQDVILTGADARIEVWDREKWERYAGEVDPNITEISTQLAGYGISI